MDLVKRVKELEGRLIEVVSASAVRFKELEEALSHANGKLNSIQDACERKLDEWKENEDANGKLNSILLQSQVEFAEQISNLIGEEE